MSGLSTFLRWEWWRIFRASLLPGVPGVLEDVAITATLLALVRFAAPGAVVGALPYLAFACFFSAVSMQGLYRHAHRPGADPLLPLLLCGISTTEVLVVRIAGVSLRVAIGIAAILPLLAAWGGLPSVGWAAGWLGVCVASAAFGGAVIMGSLLIKSRHARGQWVLGAVVAAAFVASLAANFVSLGWSEIVALSTLHWPYRIQRIEPSIVPLLAPWCASMLLGSVAAIAVAARAVGSMRRGD